MMCVLLVFFLCYGYTYLYGEMLSCCGGGGFCAFGREDLSDEANEIGSRQVD